MANDKNFSIKNGLSVGTRYLQTGGTETAGVGAGYDLDAASYDGVNSSVSSQDSAPYELVFKADGSKFYIMGFSSDTVYQYALSTAWDLSTATYDSKSFSTASQDANMQGLEFSADGTKMYACGQSDTIYQYTLSTAWDVSTASYDSVSFSTSSQISGVPWGLSFSDSGSKLYVTGSSPASIFQYNLSTAYDLSTASYSTNTLSVSSQTSEPISLKVTSDGSTAVVLSPSSLFKYTMSTAYDLSTASYSSESFDLTPQDSSMRGVDLKSDGTKAYVVAQTTATAYQYSLAALTQTLDLSTGTYFSFTPSGATTVSFTNAPASGKAVGFAVEINGDGSTITWPTSVKWHGGVAPTATASKEVYAFVTVDGGTSYYGKKAGGDIA